MRECLDLLSGFPKYIGMRYPLYCLPVLLILVVAVPAAGAEVGSEAPTCGDSSIVAGAVRTEEDIRVFVQCAYELVEEVGAEAARQAFHEEERWRSGPIYVVVVELSPAPGGARLFVFPPDPSREGDVWGSSFGGFGTDYYFEVHRMLSVVDSGWIYYSFTNPRSGREEPKSSYVIEVDWDGQRAAIGAGVYARDWPGTCYADEVSAAALKADPGDATLTEFVRCAAMVVESQGYSAMYELESERWSDGSTYVFVLA